jgi:putative MATE family efflux protein
MAENEERTKLRGAGVTPAAAPRRRSTDMTKGNPWRKLNAFAIPVLMGSLLQQLYNTVDSIIVGRAVGPTALGAVSATGAIVQLLIALFMGLSSGACVVIANFFGRKDKENINKAVHTALILAVIGGAIVLVLGVSLSPIILRAMNTPKEMQHQAELYLQIFFGGMIFLAIYNMGASIFQAVGNSRYPLYFLAFTTLLNTVGDVLLVIVFKMGVAGAAIATVFSEFVAAGLIIIVLLRSKDSIKLSFKKLKIEKPIMKRIIQIGLPGAIQQSIVSVSNIFVQSYVNGLGDTAVTGLGVANRLEGFIPLPAGAMALAATTYVGQNLGAGEEKRARKGVWVAMICAAASIGVLSIIAFFAHDLIYRSFTGNTDVLRSAWKFGQIIIPFYIFITVTSVIPGALRGAGRVKFPTAACIFCFVILRQIYLAIITKVHYEIFTVALGYPLTWATCAIVLLVFYLSKNRLVLKGTRLVKTDGTNPDFIALCKKLDEFQNEKVPGRKEAGLSSLYNNENLKDVFLLYDDKKPFGCAGLWCYDDGETCEAVRVYIATEYKGKGNAKLLINSLQNLARSLGCKKISMRSFKSLQGELDEFKEIGFTDIDPHGFKYADKYPNALLLADSRIYMELNLS